MKDKEKQYVKRTQKDYSMSFKLSVVKEYEAGGIGLQELSRKYGIQGDSTVRKWLNKYGTFDWQNRVVYPMVKTKELELLELREKIKVLERKNARLEKELEVQDLKAGFFDIMIDIAEKEYGVDIRKKCSPEQLKKSKK